MASTAQYREHKRNWYRRWRQKYPERSRANNRKSYRRNRDKRLAYGKKYYQAHKEKKLSYSKSQHLKKSYGLSKNEYLLMLEQQNWQCLICQINLKKGKPKPNIDRNHTTGKLRGILCHHCNAGLGYFKESKTILLSAINYLKQHKA